MPPIYAFGSFRFDVARGLLAHRTVVKALPERLAQILTLLIRANGDVIDKDAIASRIWPGGVVSEGNLAQHMHMLRQILDERARDREYIVTVRGRGYRFVAPVTVVVPELALAAPPPRDEPNDGTLRSDPQLLHHYWRGSYLLDKRTAEALTAAAEQFEAALQVDNAHVPSLIGLARAYALLAEYWYASGSVMFPKAKAAVVRALEIDPRSPEARATLGNILLFCDWDWAAAEREIEAALALGPKSSSVYVNAAWFYMCRGSSDVQLRRMQRALLVEPASPALQLFIARIFLHTGDYHRAIDSFSSLIESGADFSIARRHRAQAFILSGRPADAVTDLLLGPQDRAEDVALRLPLLARAYADCGDVERSEEIYRALREMARTEYVVGFNLATVAVGLKRFGEALDYLEEGLQRREPALLMLRSLPWFAPIAQRARFKALLNAIWPPPRLELDNREPRTA
ncbi:MAG: winged helix-turn-helix domain-containing protein [Candidatus Eremiobacteraeota bacterium]|nr:winged helix-turn-helix domain-containing protein [Candidatus Eremiobacteraeota bacterium]MBV9055994.1 winged helix-turn-helix domain-containing protein [Candidatus Eremiobacteraeota bacterium]MBV9698618.1 winged helix-turn-helix domain-containing protein [Candidatus Eremiobacteraeota bacterium]